MNDLDRDFEQILVAIDSLGEFTPVVEGFSDNGIEATIASDMRAKDAKAICIAMNEFKKLVRVARAAREAERAQIARNQGDFSDEGIELHNALEALCGRDE